MQEKQVSGCKLQVTSCELKNTIQRKMQDGKIVMSDEEEN